MALNITAIEGMSEGQFIELVHNTIIVPTTFLSLFMAWLLILIIGLVIIDKKRGTNPLGKFMMIMGISALFLAMLGIGIWLSPHLVNSILEWFP